MAEAHKRRIFFWTLAVLFFITTSSIVFYALGYRFSFERGIFVYAGSITIKSNPRQVNILLNNEPVPNKKINYLNNSYHVDGIKPGEYLLEVSSPGFQKWSKKITVHSGVSTEFWNILLTKEDYPKANYYTSGTEKFFISPKNKYIATIQNRAQEFLVNILDLDSAMSENIFSSTEYQFTTDEKENIEWSPQSKSLIIPTVKKGGNKHYFIVDIKTRGAVNLKDLALTENLDRVRWDSEKKDTIYYLSEKNLYQINIENPQEKKIIAENVASYDLAAGKIYYFQDPSGIVHKIGTGENQSPVQITTSPPPDMSDESYKIIVYDEKRIVLINNNIRKIFIWNQGEKDNYFHELSNDAIDAQFSDDGKKVLFWNEWEIYAYFTRKWEVQPSRSEDETLGISRFSQPIKNVQWAKDYEHIIFTVDKKIKISELDHRDYRNIMDIASLENEFARVVSNFADNKIYFTDKAQENSSFFDVYSIDFPEKNGLLGL